MAVGGFLMAAEERELTFFATSDSHYVTEAESERNQRVARTVTQMNALPGEAWPDRLGGEPIAKPLGVLMLGDIIDDGDRRDETRIQWSHFLRDFGLSGKEGKLRYPVFEGWGNHDGPPVGAEKHGFSVQARLRARTTARLASGAISRVSQNGLHYSWDWQDVHFVQLNFYPADKQNPRVRYNKVWHDPQGALQFLVADLREQVGSSRRPVVLMAHCGFDTDWWVEEDWKAFYKVVKPYNVILYLHGHSGTGIKRYQPTENDVPLEVINTGQTERGFFVLRVTGDRITAAYRLFDEKSGGWTWRHPFAREIGPRRAVR